MTPRAPSSLSFGPAGCCWACLRGLLFSALLATCVVTGWAKHLTVGTVAWAGFSSLNVAQSKGYWSERGLDVEVIVYASNQEVNSALVNGRIDIALDMIGSWVGLHQQGCDLVVLGESDWSHGGDKIIAKRAFDPSQLQGKKVGVYLNQPSVTIFLERFLRGQHLNLSEVELVEQEPSVLADSFIQGQLAIIVDYDPQALRAVEEGQGRVFATSATYPGIIPEGFASLREKWNLIPEEHRMKFWLGLLKATDWIHEPANWPEYQQILNQATYPFDPDFTEEQLRAMVGAVSIHTPAKLQERNSPGGGLARYLNELHAFLARNNQLRRPYKPGDLMATESFIKAIEAYGR